MPHNEVMMYHFQSPVIILCLSLCVSLCVSLSVSFCMSLTHSLSLSLTHTHTHTHTHISIYVYVCVYRKEYTVSDISCSSVTALSDWSLLNFYSSPRRASAEQKRLLFLSPLFKLLFPVVCKCSPMLRASFGIWRELNLSGFRDLLDGATL